MEGHGRSFPDTRLAFQVRKVIGGVVACRITQSLSSFSLDFGLKTLDLGLGFGTYDLGLRIYFC